MNINFFKSVITKLNYYGILILDSFLFYGGKFAGRFIFPVILIKNYKQFVLHASYYPECELKSKDKIFWEQLFYIFRTGEINKNYFIFGLDRKSKKDINNYVPWLTFTHARNKKNQLPNKPEYDSYNCVCLLRDKFIFEAFCKGVGLNTPSNIGMVNCGRFYALNEKEFFPVESLINRDIDAFCKRNVNYGGGMANDIFKLQIKNQEVKINNEIADLNQLKSWFGNDNWIIQKRIENQTLEFAKFHPHSINTIRIVTVKNSSEIEILCSFFRMGVHGRHADNWSSGGILVGVNIEKGELEKWGLFKPGVGTKSDYHPNSEIVFKGFKLPFWKEMVSYVKKAHLLFYNLHSIGWDVAITDDGITLIEGNDNWDTIDAQFYKGAKNKFDKYFK